MATACAASSVFTGSASEAARRAHAAACGPPRHSTRPLIVRPSAAAHDFARPPPASVTLSTSRKRRAPVAEDAWTNSRSLAATTAAARDAWFPPPCHARDGHHEPRGEGLGERYMVAALRGRIAAAAAAGKPYDSYHNLVTRPNIMATRPTRSDPARWDEADCEALPSSRLRSGRRRTSPGRRHRSRCRPRSLDVEAGARDPGLADLSSETPSGPPVAPGGAARDLCGRDSSPWRRTPAVRADGSRLRSGARRACAARRAVGGGARSDSTSPS